MAEILVNIVLRFTVDEHDETAEDLITDHVSDECERIRELVDADEVYVDDVEISQE